MHWMQIHNFPSNKGNEGVVECVPSFVLLISSKRTTCYRKISLTVKYTSDEAL